MGIDPPFRIVWRSVEQDRRRGGGEGTGGYR